MHWECQQIFKVGSLWHQIKYHEICQTCKTFYILVWQHVIHIKYSMIFFLAPITIPGSSFPIPLSNCISLFSWPLLLLPLWFTLAVQKRCSILVSLYHGIWRLSSYSESSEQMPHHFHDKQKYLYLKLLSENINAIVG